MSSIAFDEHIRSLGVDEDTQRVVGVCLHSIYEISSLVRTGMTLGDAGTKNVFGEDQIKLDVASNDIFIKNLSSLSIVERMASEEMAEESVFHDDGKFAVAIDPLDGSSLVDVNFAVGTIVGIYPKGSFVGKKPGDMVAAIVAVYGPRTTIFMSFPGKGTHNYLLTDTNFVLQKENIQVSEDGSYFAPGNLRACVSSPSYKKLVDEWISQRYTLRYSGGMVPDVNHILIKGKGVFTYPGYPQEPNGKLRLLYECGTMAFIMFEAGGSASDGAISLMDKPIEHIDQRTPIFIGSKNEVEKAVAFFR